MLIQRLKKMEKSIDDYSINRGEVTDDRKDVFARRLKLYEKLKTGAQALAECLGLEMPTLPLDDGMDSMGMGITIGRTGRDENQADLGVWEDEETKLFYEKLIDLRNIVPVVLLGEGVTAVENNDSSPLEAAVEETEEPGDDVVLGGASKKVALDAIITKLQNLSSSDAVDQLAIDFAYLNKRKTRKRLSEELLAVSRQRLDLLPYYSRLIATLAPYMPDISTFLVEEVCFILI